MRSGWGSSQTYKNKTGPWLPWKQQQAIFEFQKPSLFKRGQEQNLRENKKSFSFRFNGFALSLALKLRPGATRKWPTCLLRSRHLGRHATSSSKKGHARARQQFNFRCARAICKVLELLSRTACYLRVTPLPVVALKGKPSCSITLTIWRTRPTCNIQNISVLP